MAAGFGFQKSGSSDVYKRQPQAMAGQIHAADALLAKKQCTPQDLLERIKTMSARKRGPRKGTLRQAPPSELAAAS